MCDFVNYAHLPGPSVFLHGDFNRLTVWIRITAFPTKLHPANLLDMDIIPSELKQSFGRRKRIVLKPIMERRMVT